MGKPRFSDLSEEDQLKVKREVARELNEAAQNARDAGRQLAAAVGALEADISKTTEAIVNAHMDEVNKHLNQALADLNAVIKREEARTREHYTNLLSADADELILNTCAMVLHLAVPTITIENWREQLNIRSAEHLQAGCTCNGCRLAGAQVFVTTDPALAPPGTIVIDGR